MSPELANGNDYNRGADVYALGCVLYELMTLTMPWADVQVGPLRKSCPCPRSSSLCTRWLSGLRLTSLLVC